MANQQTRIFKPTAPIKGSFPLDHEGVCKAQMLRYMICIQSSEGRNSACRPQAQEYFSCRMDHKLMDREEWTQLGFGEKDHKPPSEQSQAKPN